MAFLNTKAGIPYPVDHIVFTFILWIIVYIPTKILYKILSMFYGPVQNYKVDMRKPNGPNVGEMINIVKNLSEQVS